MESPESVETRRTSAGNVAFNAFEQMRSAFADDAQQLGLNDEQDVVELVKRVRGNVEKKPNTFKCHGILNSP